MGPAFVVGPAQPASPHAGGAGRCGCSWRGGAMCSAPPLRSCLPPETPAAGRQAPPACPNLSLLYPPLYLLCERPWACVASQRHASACTPPVGAVRPTAVHSTRACPPLSLRLPSSPQSVVVRVRACVSGGAPRLPGGRMPRRGMHPLVRAARVAVPSPPCAQESGNFG